MVDMNANLEHINPDNVIAPQGLYSHVVKVPAGTELLFVSGQLGIAPDGSTPGDIAGQADRVFANLVSILASQGMGVGSIVKLTTFIVAGQDGQAVRNARLKYLGDHRPASTAVYVSQLVDPAWYVEVEAVASRPAEEGAG